MCLPGLSLHECGIYSLQKRKINYIPIFSWTPSPTVVAKMSANWKIFFDVADSIFTALQTKNPSERQNLIINRIPQNTDSGINQKGWRKWVLKRSSCYNFEIRTLQNTVLCYMQKKKPLQVETVVGRRRRHLREIPPISLSTFP